MGVKHEGDEERAEAEENLQEMKPDAAAVNGAGRAGKPGGLDENEMSLDDAEKAWLLRTLGRLAGAGGGDEAGDIPPRPTPEDVQRRDGEWRKKCAREFELSEEEAEKLDESIASGGIDKMWRVGEYSIERDRRPLEDDELFHLSTEAIQNDSLMRQVQPDPLWQAISGIRPRSERRMRPAHRAAGIRDLMRCAEKVLRQEMKNAAKNPCPDRRATWDPLHSLCFYLNISRSKLNGYSLEHSGVSALGLVDLIRVEGVREKMKTELRKYVASLQTSLHHEDHEGHEEHEGNGSGKKPAIEVARQLFESIQNAPVKNREDVVALASALWKLLRESRRAAGFSRTSLALQFGFPNHARFHKASQLHYGHSVVELEWEVLCEVVMELCGVKEEEHTGAENYSAPGMYGYRVRFAMPHSLGSPNARAPRKAG